MGKALLTVLITTWNEEDTILDTIKWYRDRVPGCTIVICDNESDDRTVEICKENNCIVRTFSTGGYMDELTLMQIRNETWKEYNSFYYIVVDSDEWVDISEKELLENLKSNRWDLCKCFGYNMFGECGDADSLVNGVPSPQYCKPVLFRDTVLFTNFYAGSHDSQPVGSVPLKIIKDWPALYHTKWRCWEKGIERQYKLAKRRSEHSKQMGWNFHYEIEESVQRLHYEHNLKISTKVR